MSQQEDKHRVVIYVAAGSQGEGWDTLCVRQADLVLLVGNAADKPLETLPSRDLLRVACNDTNARQELVLLHVDPVVGYHPTGTRHWIQALNDAGAHLQHHHHLRMHTTDAEYDRCHLKSDFMRISRYLYALRPSTTLLYMPWLKNHVLQVAHEQLSRACSRWRRRPWLGSSDGATRT